MCEITKIFEPRETLLKKELLNINIIFFIWPGCNCRYSLVLTVILQNKPNIFQCSWYTFTVIQSWYTIYNNNTQFITIFQKNLLSRRNKGGYYHLKSFPKDSASCVVLSEAAIQRPSDIYLFRPSFVFQNTRS